MLFKSALFSSAIFILAAIGAADDFISGEIVNYRDFSRINSIAVGFDYVYFGAPNGVTRYNPRTRKWADPLSGPENANILEIRAEANDRKIWVRTDLGFFEFSATFGYWIPVERFPDDIYQGRHVQPEAIYIPPAGYTYLPSGALIDGIGRTFSLTDIVDDGWSNLWIGTWGLGVARADVSILRMELLNFGMISEDISAVYSDNGVLIMGGESKNSYRAGITLFDWRRNVFNYIETEGSFLAPASDINDIAADDERIYAAMDNGVLAIEKGRSNRFQPVGKPSQLRGLRVNCLLLSDGLLYAGSSPGLNVLRPKNDSDDYEIETYLPFLDVLCLDKVGSAIWIGSSGGVYRFDPETKKAGRLSISEISERDSIVAIAHNGREIWIASDINLISIDLRTAKVVSYPEIDAYGTVTAIAATDSTLAISAPNGLLLTTLDGRLERRVYTKKCGILSNEIRDMIFDGDYLWLGTDSGLTRFQYKNPPPAR
jgi:ligand-binding sensor domain-containing protein